MSGSLGKSKSKNSNEFGFNQDVWGGQQQGLQDMYGSAGDLFGQTNQQMQGQIPGAMNQMQGIAGDSNQAWQNQMQGGAYSGMDLQGNYQNALGGGGNEQFIDQSIMGGAGNDYVAAMKQQMGDQSNTNLGQSLAMNDLRATGAGQSGSSRHGMTESSLYKNAGDRLGDQQTRLGFQTFDRDLDRKLGIAQRADTYDMNKLNNTSGMLASQQGAMAGGAAGGKDQQQLAMGQFAPSMAPWQGMGQYSNTMGSPTVLSSGSGSGSGSAKGMGASGGGK